MAGRGRESGHRNDVAGLPGTIGSDILVRDKVPWSGGAPGPCGCGDEGLRAVWEGRLPGAGGRVDRDLPLREPSQSEGRGLVVFRPPEYAALINPMVNDFPMNNLFHHLLHPQGTQKVECPFCEAMPKCHCSDVGPREWSPRTGKCPCKRSKQT